MSEIKISLFKPSRNGKPGAGKPFETDFYAEIEKIQDGTHYNLIKQLREITDHNEKAEFKRSKLQAFTVSCLCPEHRQIKGAIPSGLLALDLDPKHNPSVTDWGFVRDMLFELPGVVASALSASGMGCFYVVKIDPSKFKDTFWSIADELKENFGLVIDPGCHDISRLRFVSADADAKVNHDFAAIPLTVPTEAYLYKKQTRDDKIPEYTGELTTADCERTFSYAVKSAEKKFQYFGDGVKHSFLAHLAGWCNYVGMTQGYCEAMVATKYLSMTDIDVDKLLIPVRNIYRTYKARHGLYVNDFEKRKKAAQITGHVVDKYIHKGIKPGAEQLDEIAQQFEANIEQVQEIAERVVVEYKEEFNSEAIAENKEFRPFWYIDEDEKMTISKMQFRNFLMKNGVHRFAVGLKWVLIQEVDNIVEEITKADLKRIVFSYIERMKEYEVWELLANRVSSVFADDYLEILPKREVHKYRDPKGSIALFYRNGVILTTAERFEFIEWRDWKYTVWRKQIIDRDIELSEYELGGSDFDTFLQNVAKRDDARYMALKCSIGYMIHSYKNASGSPAIILNDEVISDVPEGGTGKGLIMTAISHLRSVVDYDGKKLDLNKQFVHSRVEQFTDIMWFDDVKKNFKFEDLFSELTQGVEVERKNGHLFKIPFSESPKIAITTNYSLPGTGGSEERRRHELELAQFYSKTKKPEHEFGMQFFTEWGVAHWNAFDNFIFRCCNDYLIEGLVPQILINQPVKQLYAMTSEEFVKWMDEEYDFVTGGTFRLNYGNAFKSYNELYPSKMAAKTFYSHIRAYLKYHEINYSDEKSGSERFYLIKGKDIQELF